MNKFYLHCAIPYVNAAPHIGHAQEFIYADTIARYRKLLGNDVRLLCGADENGLKIVQAAEKAGMSTQDFCDVHQAEFLDLAEKLIVRFDVWQRGSDKKTHFPSSQKLWQLCDKNGDIYKKTYTGLYCVGCEAFYTKEELDEKGECLEHPGRKLDRVSEENFFFRLSRYQSYIEKLIAGDTLKVTPNIRKNEALSFVRRGLEDFSISRSRQRAKNWGVPVPNDPTQIIYVWFDALNIYQSGIGFGLDEKKYKKWAPANVMVIGKGILRFHAVYWPAILKSAGLPIPKELFVHGYLTVDGQKMSKTVGNVVDPSNVVQKYGTDAVRYYLLREIPSYSDGDFSEKRFKEIYNADLANGLGNLASRISKLCEKITVNSDSTAVFDKDYKDGIENYQFDSVLDLVWDKIRSLDKYLEKEKPWKISDEKNLKKVMTQAVAQLKQIAFELQPFLPDTAEKILRQFSGKNIKSQSPLFPRIS